jgi:hypothetical protein
VTRDLLGLKPANERILAHAVPLGILPVGIERRELRKRITGGADDSGALPLDNAARARAVSPGTPEGPFIRRVLGGWEGGGQIRGRYVIIAKKLLMLPTTP